MKLGLLKLTYSVKARTFPLAWKDAMLRELEKMEMEDLFESVTEPPTWISNILAVPKPGNPEDLRIVLDSRVANKAIKREYYIMKSVDELITEVNGARVKYSKN